MKILLIGYGKMGKTIEQTALRRGHQIAGAIGIDNAEELALLPFGFADIAIEFTEPEAAFNNLKLCIDKSVPVVCGTTGWLHRRDELEQYCKEKNGTFFYASNFSLGVNIFFRLNKVLASWMNTQADYDVRMQEIHHTEKKDAPSGTAITLAEGIMAGLSRKTTWVLGSEATPEQIAIEALRIDKVPGTHTITYSSAVDEIEIKHTAHSREGFALGAVMAAEWLQHKKGVFGMDDLMGF
jgi:4-hydroxy-tetrahydrodipicolinate reductase